MKGERALENRVKEIDERKELLKKQIRENDRQTKEKEKDKSFKLTEENVLNQDWHDARYYAAIKAGASHSAAWFQEKKRRRATIELLKGFVLIKNGMLSLIARKSRKKSTRTRPLAAWKLRPLSKKKAR